MREHQPRSIAASAFFDSKSKSRPSMGQKIWLSLNEQPNASARLIGLARFRAIYRPISRIRRVVGDGRSGAILCRRHD